MSCDESLAYFEWNVGILRGGGSIQEVEEAARSKFWVPLELRNGMGWLSNIVEMQGKLLN